MVNVCCSGEIYVSNDVESRSILSSAFVSVESLRRTNFRRMQSDEPRNGVMHAAILLIILRIDMNDIKEVPP